MKKNSGLMPFLSVIAIALAVFATGCAQESLVEKEMWRINFLLEQSRGAAIKGRLEDAYARSQEMLIQLRSHREETLDAQEEIDSLKTKMDLLVKLREPMERDVAEWESKGTLISASLSEVKAASDKAQQELERARQEYAEIMASAEQVPEPPADLKAKWETIKNDLDSWTTRISQAASQIADLESQKKAIDSRIEKARSEITAGNATLEDINKAKAAGGDMALQVKKALDEVAALEKSRNDAKERQAAVEKEIAELKDRIANLASGKDSVAKELEAILARKGPLSEEIARAKAEIDVLTKEKSDVESKAETIRTAAKTATENLEIMKQINDEMIVETEKARSDSAKLLETKTKLDEEIAKLKKEIEEIKKQRDEKKRERDAEKGG